MFTIEINDWGVRDNLIVNTAQEVADIIADAGVGAFIRVIFPDGRKIAWDNADDAPEQFWTTLEKFSD